MHLSTCHVKAGYHQSVPARSTNGKYLLIHNPPQTVLPKEECTYNSNNLTTLARDPHQMVTTSTQGPLPPWAITNTLPFGTTNHETPLSPVAPLNFPNLMAYGQRVFQTTSSSIDNTILKKDVVIPHKNETRPQVQRCKTPTAFHPETRS